MAITTRTDICNLALSRVAAKRINSYDSEESTEARACRLHLDIVIDSLLQRHQWSFATKRADLSKIATPPASEWATAWQLPEDCVRLIRIVGGSPHSPVRSFAREGRMLLMGGADACAIVYVSNAVPVPQWDPLFANAAAFALAAEIATDIAKNGVIADQMRNALEALALPVAETMDAREVASGENFGTRTMIGMSSLVASRYHPYRGGSHAPLIPPPPGTP